MFLQSLRSKNPAFVEAAVALHQAGAIPANSYAVDLDAVAANTAHLMGEARALGLTVYAMTKQLGRAPGALDAITVCWGPRLCGRGHGLCSAHCRQRAQPRTHRTPRAGGFG